ncbi:MAG: sulfite exporter TauE/SafE family protein [Nitrospinota bacterium]|nr:sulfite exporter TauE/SafE family protein [Nitrospinota bacterium]
MSCALEPAALPFLIFIAALLYSSVGHGGASGYLAAMALLSVAPEKMKPTALFLNILVSSIALVRFGQVGAFHWRTFWPFAAASIPLAFLGGLIALQGAVYKWLVGAALLFAAFQMFRSSAGSSNNGVKPPSLPLALLGGGGIGFLSGLTGVGGGIFLSPLLILAGWADPRHTAGVSAAFILVNSISGLSGHLASGGQVPADIWILTVTAIAGGYIGSGVGSRHFSNTRLRRVLGAVLVAAGIKFILSA